MASYVYTRNDYVGERQRMLSEYIRTVRTKMSPYIEALQFSGIPTIEEIVAKIKEVNVLPKRFDMFSDYYSQEVLDFQKFVALRDCSTYYLLSKLFTTGDWSLKQSLTQSFNFFGYAKETIDDIIIKCHAYALAASKFKKESIKAYKEIFIATLKKFHKIWDMFDKIYRAFRELYLCVAMLEKSLHRILSVVELNHYVLVEKQAKYLPVKTFYSLDNIIPILPEALLEEISQNFTYVRQPSISCQPLITGQLAITLKERWQKRLASLRQEEVVERSTT